MPDTSTTSRRAAESVGSLLGFTLCLFAALVGFARLWVVGSSGHPLLAPFASLSSAFTAAWLGAVHFRTQQAPGRGEYLVVATVLAAGVAGWLVVGLLR